MAGRMRLRAAQRGDLDEVVAIERESFADPWSLQDFTTVLSAPGAIFLVAADGASRRIAGYVIVQSVLDESEILNIAVAAGHRCAGIGAALLDAALAAVKKLGSAVEYLEVRESNAAARRLYASRGFREISRRPRYYRNPVEDALVLRRAVERMM